MTSLTSDLARLANNANVLISAITTNSSAITSINVGGVAINSSGLGGGPVTFSNDVTISGNLTVSGTTVTVNTQTLDVKDLNITIAKGAGSASAANGAGITVDSGYANLYYSSSANAWTSTVGFGVGTVPSTKFHIYGSNNDTLSRLEVSNTTYTAQYHINRGSGKDTYIGPATNNSYVDFWTYENLPIRFGSNNADIMRLCSNGNVGIACTAPGASLEVYGKIRCPVDTSVGYFDIGSFGSYIGRNSGDGATYFNYAQSHLYFKFGGSDTVMFAANGNVGIGSTTPNHKLLVSGSAYVTGTFYAGAGGNAAITSDARTLNLGDGGETVSCDAAAGGYTYLVRESTGIVQLGARGGGNVKRINLYANTVAIGPSTGTLFTVANGNVGIGTSSPGYPLDLQYSSGTFSSRIYNTNSNTASAVNADNFVLLQNYYGITQISNWQNLGMRIGSRQIQNGGNGHIYFTVAGDSLHSFMAANGNMGIGTVSPGYKLDVVGNIIVRGDQGFNATNETATLYIGDNASYLQAVFDGGLDFYQNSTFRMRLQGGTGNLGIGTNNPGNKLHIKKDDSADLVRLQNGQTNGGLWDIKIGGGGWNNKAFIIGRRTDSADSYSLYIDNSDNIGFGTNNPLTGLEVYRGGEVGSIVHWPGASRGGLWALSTQRVALTTTNTADDLVFGYLNPSVANSFVEQARLDTSTSKMRIGTSTTLPSETLELYKTGGGVSIRWHYPGTVEYKGGIAAGESLFRFGNANGDAGQSSISHLTMTNAGRVGIHSTSQGNYNLFVQTDNGNYAPMKISGSGLQAWGIGLVVETTGGTDGAGIVWRSRGTKNWQIRGETSSTGFQICEDGGDGSDGANFGTARMHFKPGGNVGIGNTDPGHLLRVEGTFSTAGTCYLYGSATQSVTNYGYLSTSTGYYSGTQNPACSIYAPNGRIITTEINCTSDRRLKRNINTIDETVAMAFVKNVNPVSFNWIEGRPESDGDRIGYIAQDVIKAGFPNLVSIQEAGTEECNKYDKVDPVTNIENPEDAFFNLNYNDSAALLHRALQAALNKIEALEARVSELESK